MNQLVRMGVMFAILLGIALYAMWRGPEPAPEKTRARVAAPAPRAEAPPPPTASPPSADKPPPAVPPPAAQAPADAAAAEVEADAEAPEGPFTYSLGEHEILLMGEGRRFLKLGVTLVMDSAMARDEVRRRRRQLVRMLFFLGSKRQADGAEGAAGRERFERDLKARFGNAIKTGAVNEVEFTRYEVFSRPPPDAGAD